VDAELKLEVLCDECSERVTATAEKVTDTLRVKVEPCKTCVAKVGDITDIDLDVVINGQDRQNIFLQSKIA
jgi:hypothetical protein